MPPEPLLRPSTRTGKFPERIGKESGARTGCRWRRAVRPRHLVGRAARPKGLPDRKAVGRLHLAQWQILSGHDQGRLVVDEDDHVAAVPQIDLRPLMQLFVIRLL